MIVLHGNGTVEGLADGSIGTAKLADTSGAGAAVSSGGAINIGGIRIQYGTTTCSSGSNHGNASTYGYSCTWSANATVSFSGFANTPLVVASPNTDYHESKLAGIYSRSASGCTIKVNSSRQGGCESVVVHWVAIGDPS
tara:strand:- start:321 stop:737 length:417 start_codon:yes stop_codon:yes gene_type:complete